MKLLKTHEDSKTWWSHRCHHWQNAPKVLDTLGLASASGGIQKAIAGSGKARRRRTKTGGLGMLTGTLLGGPAAPLVGKLLIRVWRCGCYERDDEESLEAADQYADRQDIEKSWLIANSRETYSKDTIPTNPKDYECLVINLEDYYYFDGDGTHWVAVYNGGRHAYFDSFGMRPPSVVFQYAEDGIVKFQYATGYE